MDIMLKGVFPSLPTPFLDDYSVDYESLKKVVEFAISAGAHGLFALDIAGEFFALTDEERKKCAETILETANSRVPVIINVSAASEEQSFIFAKHAEKIGAAGIVSTPPFFRAQSKLRIIKYYQQLNECTNLPIILQNAPENMGTAIDVDLQAQIIRENSNIQYAMEECVGAQLTVSHALSNMQEIPHFKGVVTGSCGQLMLHDYYRGVRMFVPQAELTDLFVKLWDALESQDETLAMEWYQILAPVLMFGSSYQRSLAKGMLLRRGIIATSVMRESSKPVFDDIQLRELDYWVEQLLPHFSV